LEYLQFNEVDVSYVPGHSQQYSVKSKGVTIGLLVCACDLGRFAWFTGRPPNCPGQFSFNGR